MKDKETQQLLMVAGIVIIVLFVFRPKQKADSAKYASTLSFSGEDLVQSPKQGEDKEYENSAIAIKAMRSAITAGESKSELDKLNRDIFKEYNIRVYEKSGKLVARNNKGADIARES